MQVHISFELTGVVIAAIAALALWFAWRQVREMQESTSKQADSARNVELQTRADIRMCGFFETVGYVARVGYVPIDDVINLLGGSILETGRLFRPHIQRLTELPAGDPRMYEHFLWLLSTLEKRVSTSLASV